MTPCQNADLSMERFLNLKSHDPKPSANEKDISGLRDDTSREATRRKTAVPVMFPYLNLNNVVFYYVYDICFCFLFFFTFGSLTSLFKES